MKEGRLGRIAVPVAWLYLPALAPLLLAVSIADATEPRPDGDTRRIVLVGDSITGLSRNAAFGFAHALEKAFAATGDGRAPEIVALGGSGQSVAGWLGVEKNSRTEEVRLDVPGIDVKAALDLPADVLVVMLGMNDVLAPYVGETPDAIDRWQENYRKLVAALRRRAEPQVLCLASITPCTEDPASPKNRLIAAMNERVRALADEEGARYVAASEAVWDILRQGRSRNPAFHVTYDFVHPNAAGHLGVALAILDGLGESAAADWLRRERLAALWTDAAAGQPGISGQRGAAEPTAIPGRFRFRIRPSWTALAAADAPAPRFELVVPAGWEASPRVVSGVGGLGAGGELTVVGSPDRSRTTLTLLGTAGAEERRASVILPAPWLVAAKLILPFWDGNDFDAEKGRTPVDDVIERGGEFTAAIDVGKGQTLDWRPVFPSVDYTGLDDPASVDFATVSHAANFEAGYAARRIHSDRDRPVTLEIGSRMFAGNVHLTVWLNGEVVSRGKLAKGTVPGRLRAGWNTLVIKACHRTWQWQVAVGLVGVDGDPLEDLRYAIP